jgi:superfamily I DNA/RNA helicase
VAVKVDTIHSVKGQTLRALLLVETFNDEYDLLRLLKDGYLKGSPTDRRPGPRRLRQLKLAYVAMTRPKDLLCLAMLDDHVGDTDRRALGDLGWVVKALQ